MLSKGRVAIPKDVRETLGVNRGDRIYFLVDGKFVCIVNSAVYA
ncbi:MAG: AbrB/MazE/SpoVT family DNA-binding domain-containing protein [Oxalobacter sp.]|nr:AbrB/MazE/SpoVT family DNA-binding domain-containing protein [Oxalobacter sp.]